jgi:signal transduction histidine kinase
MNASLRDPARVLVLAAVYVALGRLGLMMDAVSGFATLVWAPTGLSLAALLLYGPAVWPGIALGAFVVNILTGATPPVALGIAVGNTLEAVAGAYALRRVTGFSPKLETLRDTLALILLAALGSTLVSASVGVLSLRLGGIVTAPNTGETWRAWWVGDVMGDLVVAPLLLTWLTRPVRVRRESRSARRVAEAFGIALPLVAMTLFVLGGPPGEAGGAFRQPHLIFPLLIWSALRFGPRGATSATLLVSAAAVVGTAFGEGPFVRETLSRSLVFLQTFMAAAAATTLILSAASEERRQALAIRDSLISMASHELKTPLTSLQLQVQMLGRAVRQADDPRRTEQLTTGTAAAERYVKRLDGLVNELLDVSRITAGRLRLDSEDVDLEAVAREVIGRLPEPERSLFAVASPAPVVGKWDRMRIEQIVTNLLSNAVKYGGGKPVDVVVDRAGRLARLAVTDHGLGISREDQRRVFEPFERGTSGDGIGGFGLGLWIVREVVDALRGTIRVESEVGAGSTFTVELPVDDSVSRS